MIHVCIETGQVFEIPGDIKFCPGCGKKRHPRLTTWKCADTGETFCITGNPLYCPGCGKILPRSWREIELVEDKSSPLKYKFIERVVD